MKTKIWWLRGASLWLVWPLLLVAKSKWHRTGLQKQAAEYRQLTSTVEADVSLNPYEWLFLGPLYFGTPIMGATWAEPDVLQFIYDTSSDYVAVTSSNCGDLCI